MKTHEVKSRVFVLAFFSRVSVALPKTAIFLGSLNPNK